MGRHAAALDTLRELVRKWPNDASLYHELAVAAGAAGKRDEALRAEQRPIVCSQIDTIPTCVTESSYASWKAEREFR